VNVGIVKVYVSRLDLLDKKEMKLVYREEKGRTISIDCSEEKKSTSSGAVRFLSTVK
jgi:hypothetical protein